MTSLFMQLLLQGSYGSWKTWKVMEFGLFFLQALKVMENWYLDKKSWKVMELQNLWKFVFSIIRCVKSENHFFFKFWNAFVMRLCHSILSEHTHKFCICQPTLARGKVMEIHGNLTSKVMECHGILFGKKCMNPVSGNP